MNWKWVALVCLGVSITLAFVAAAGNSGADRLAAGAAGFGLAAFASIAWVLYQDQKEVTA